MVHVLFYRYHVVFIDVFDAVFKTMQSRMFGCLAICRHSNDVVLSRGLSDIEPG